MTREEEQALIRRVLAGDADAFEPLVTENQTRAFHLACRLLGNETDAADAVQDFSAAVTLSQKTGLRMTMAVIPIIGLIIAFFWFKKRYILTDEKVAEIAADVQKRRAAQ